jgi:hypothetical protein
MAYPFVADSLREGMMGYQPIYWTLIDTCYRDGYSSSVE